MCQSVTPNRPSDSIVYCSKAIFTFSYTINELIFSKRFKSLISGME